MKLYIIASAIALFISGCTSEGQPYPLNEEVARESLEKAMRAWADGKSPEDLKPEIIVGDSHWEKRQQLLAFHIVSDQETTDGSNLHIPVKLTLDRSGKPVDITVTYIVGTSPVITIFPQ